MVYPQVLYRPEGRRTPGTPDILPRLVTSKEKTSKRFSRGCPLTLPCSTFKTPLTLRCPLWEGESRLQHERMLMGRTTWCCFCLCLVAKFSVWLKLCCGAGTAKPAYSYQAGYLHLRSVPGASAGVRWLCFPELHDTRSKRTLEVIDFPLSQTWPWDSAPEPQVKGRTLREYLLHTAGA